MNSICLYINKHELGEGGLCKGMAEVSLRRLSESKLPAYIESGLINYPSEKKENCRL